MLLACLMSFECQAAKFGDHHVKPRSSWSGTGTACCIAMSYCLSQMFVDFRKYAFLHFYISAFLHCGISTFRHCYFLSLSIWIRQNPLESIDWNPSVGSGLESRNEIISDVYISLAMLLAFLRCFPFSDVLAYPISGQVTDQSNLMALTETAQPNVLWPAEEANDLRVPSQLLLAWT